MGRDQLSDPSPRRIIASSLLTASVDHSRSQPAAEVPLTALRASVWLDASQAAASSEPITSLGNLEGNFGCVMFCLAETTPSAGSLHVDRRDRWPFQIGWWHKITLTEKESGFETPLNVSVEGIGRRGIIDRFDDFTRAGQRSR